MTKKMEFDLYKELLEPQFNMSDYIPKFIGIYNGAKVFSSKLVPDGIIYLVKKRET